MARRALLAIAALCFPRALAVTPAPDCVVTTFAGSATNGAADGAGTAASFGAQLALALDRLPLADSLLIVADRVNNRVRRVSPAGVVTTWAVDVVSPTALAQAADGTLYLSESMTLCRIRAVSPAGAVSTLSGGVCIYADGVAAAAGFSQPRALWLNAGGTLLVVAEAGRVRLVTVPGGAATTLAGAGALGTVDGRGAAARVNCNTHCGLARAPWAPDGLTLILADGDAARLRTVNLATGDVGTWAGGGPFANGNGVGTAAAFSAPAGVADDGTGAGALLVADVNARLVRRVTAGGAVSLLLGSGFAPAGSYADGVGAAATFGGNLRSAIGAGGLVYFSDAGAVRVAACPAALATPSPTPAVTAGASASATPAATPPPTGTRTPTPAPTAPPAGACLVTTLVGKTANTTAQDGAGAAAQFFQPRGVAVGPGDVIFFTANDHVVRSVTLAGALVSTLAGLHRTSGFADGAGTVARFFTPTGICWDAVTGALTLSDGGNSRIRRVTVAGVATTLASGFNWPQGGACDAAGNFFFAEQFAHRIRRVTPLGAVSVLAGTGAAGFSDGPALSSQVNTPLSAAFDAPTGGVLAADTAGVRFVTAAGQLMTLAGGTVAAYNDGASTASTFVATSAVLPDGFGGVLIGDAFALRRLDAARATVVTLAGGGLAAGAADGYGASARFSTVRSLALTSTGLIVAADLNNHAIRIVSCPYASASASPSVGAAPSATPSLSPTVSQTASPSPAACAASVLAGLTGTMGFADGTGAAVRMNAVNGGGGAAFLPDGRFLFLDKYNHRLRAIWPNGTVETVCGAGGSGTAAADGPCGAALFRFPGGMALAPAGATVYVCEPNTNAVRVVDLVNGIVSTLSGGAGGVFNAVGWGDGPGAIARFYGPEGVALDGEGMLYVCDKANHRIRKVSTQTGWTTTLAGSGAAASVDGFATAASINGPRGIAVTPDGATIFVVEFEGARVRAITASGWVSTLAGGAPTSGSTPVDGIGALATFISPTHLSWAADGATLLLADSGSARLRSVTLTGTVTTIGGAPVAPSTTVLASAAYAPASLYGAGVAIVLTTTDIRLLTCAGGPSATPSPAPTAPSATRTPSATPSATPTAFASGGCVVSTLVGAPYPSGIPATGFPASAGAAGGVGTAARLGCPFQGAWLPDSTTLVVADRCWHTIKTVTQDGVVATLSGSGVAGYADGAAAAAQYKTPQGVCVHPSEGATLVVANTGSHALQLVALSDGAASPLAGSAGAAGSGNGVGSNAQFSSPSGVACGSDAVYVSDNGNDRIRKVTYAGVATTLTGSTGGGFVNGVGTNAFFAGLHGLRFAPGRGGEVLMAADQSTCSVRAVNITSGAATTLIGFGTGCSGTNGNATTFAALNTPRGASADAYGGIYVVENNGHRVRYFSPAGQLSTVAGGLSINGFRDGPASVAQFSQPQDVLVTVNNTLWVLDAGNSALRVVTCPPVATPSPTPTASATATPAATQSATPSASPSPTRTPPRASATPFACAVVTLAGGALPGSRDGVGTNAAFSLPVALAVNATTLYVAQAANATLRAVALGSAATATLQSAVGGAAAGLALDAASGLAYVSRALAHTVVAFPANGTGAAAPVAGFAGVPGFADGVGALALFNRPGALAGSQSPFILYVADVGNAAVRVVRLGGIVTTLAGAGVAGASDGVGRGASFDILAALAFDTSRQLLWVADGSLIRTVSPGGIVTTVAGRAGVAAFADGLGSNALLSSPAGIVVAPGGGVYVSDTGSFFIRTLTLQPDGAAALVATVAGSGALGAGDAASGAAASFSAPRALAVGSTGILYVADGTRVRVLTCAPFSPTATRSATPSAGAPAPSATPTATAPLGGCVISRLAGLCALPGTADGSAAAAGPARLAAPAAVAPDGLGNFFVLDASRVRILFANGTLATVAGGVSGFKDSALGNMAALFASPRGAAAGSTAGEVWIAECVLRAPRAAPCRLVTAYSPPPPPPSPPIQSFLLAREITASADSRTPTRRARATSPRFLVIVSPALQTQSASRRRFEAPRPSPSTQGATA